MVHELAKQYGWSKSQINEVYPEEATLFLKFIAHEKKDKLLQAKMDYYSSFLDKLYIHHGLPEEQRARATEALEKLQNLKIQIRPAPDGSGSGHDDDLPDLEKMRRLKSFMKSRG